VAGPAIAALDIAGDPGPWRDVGFAVGDDGLTRVGSVELRIGGPGRGITRWTLRDAAGAGDVDGVPTGRTAAPPPDGPAPGHPNGALSIDHVVVAAPDADRVFGALQATGMVLKRERTAGPADHPLRQGFFRHGEVIIEVMAPAEPEEGAGAAPSRLWGLTVVVADIDAAAALLGDRLGTVRDAVQPGRRIGTVRREAGLGVPLALISVG
jgi:hypothetical protein